MWHRPEGILIQQTLAHAKDMQNREKASKQEELNVNTCMQYHSTAVGSGSLIRVPAWILSGASLWPSLCPSWPSTSNQLFTNHFCRVKSIWDCQLSPNSGLGQVPLARDGLAKTWRPHAFMKRSCVNTLMIVRQLLYSRQWVQLHPRNEMQRGY